jgi:hypothetical protein
VDALAAPDPAASPLASVSRADLEEMLRGCQEAELQGTAAVGALRVQLDETRRQVEAHQATIRETAAKLEVRKSITSGWFMCSSKMRFQ